MSSSIYFPCFQRCLDKFDIVLGFLLCSAFFRGKPVANNTLEVQHRKRTLCSFTQRAPYYSHAPLYTFEMYGHKTMTVFHIKRKAQSNKNLSIKTLWQ